MALAFASSVLSIQPGMTTLRTRGSPLGLALWYPTASARRQPPVFTQLDYRLLEFSKPLDASAKRDNVDEEAGMMVAWRHIGIVPLRWIRQGRLSRPPDTLFGPASG